MLAQKKSAAKPGRRSRGRPKLDEVADIDRELLDVALGEFIKHGYGETSMAEIVKVAGVSKTTLYSRYSSKEALFTAIMQKLIDSSLVSQLLSIDDEEKGLSAGLKSFGKKALRLSMTELSQGMDRLLYSESHRFPELGEAARKRREYAVEVISGFVARCAQKEGIPCEDPVPPAKCFLTILRGMQAQAVLMNLSVTEEQRERWVEIAVDTLLNARADW